MGPAREPALASTTWNEWISSRTGLWLTISRSVSPGSRRSSTPAAAGRRRSPRRQRGTRVYPAPSPRRAPLPGWVDLEERELDERPLGHARDVNGALAPGCLARAPAPPSRADSPRRPARSRSACCPGERPSSRSLIPVPGIRAVLSAGIGPSPQARPTSTSARGPPGTPLSVRRPAAVVTGNRSRAALAGGPRAGRGRPGEHRPGAARIHLRRRDPITARPLAGSPALIAVDGRRVRVPPRAGIRPGAPGCRSPRSGRAAAACRGLQETGGPADRARSLRRIAICSRSASRPGLSRG